MTALSEVVAATLARAPARVGRAGAAGRAARRDRRGARPTTSRDPVDHGEMARLREVTRAVEAVRHAAFVEAALGGPLFR